eukprot:scaffold2979_cov405-Prasinococcus_capsulatus_cf.AAC.1
MKHVDCKPVAANPRPSEAHATFVRTFEICWAAAILLRRVLAAGVAMQAPLVPHLLLLSPILACPLSAGTTPDRPPRPSRAGDDRGGHHVNRRLRGCGRSRPEREPVGRPVEHEDPLPLLRCLLPLQEAVHHNHTRTHTHSAHPVCSRPRGRRPVAWPRYTHLTGTFLAPSPGPFRTANKIRGRVILGFYEFSPPLTPQAVVAAVGRIHGRRQRPSPFEPAPGPARGDLAE